jgi:hypothetical protein
MLCLGVRLAKELSETEWAPGPPSHWIDYLGYGYQLIAHGEKELHYHRDQVSLAPCSPTSNTKLRRHTYAVDVLGSAELEIRVWLFGVVYLRCSTRNKSDRLRVYPKT